MARTEWLRTFLAVYRAGSVTDGARRRMLSQPAASQQLAGLERSVGAALFVRTPGGVEPTSRGRELYGEVADPLDRLEGILAGLDAGAVPARPAAVRVGCTAEYFHAEALPRLAGLDLAVTARFGDDLLRDLAQGDLDVVVTDRGPGRQAVGRPVGEKRFVLVADRPPAAEIRSLPALGDWLAGRRWVAYSHELPITRRFWRESLGRPFGADLRLVAPDLRVVAAAVVAGMGVSILPTFVCADALAAGGMVEVYPVAIPAEPWIACTRPGDDGRPAVAAVLDALAG
ncbi:MAG TPA: LysR family transcriptional regulator [Acidimicrobiales bacterium]|nr:LysR family transcriptional regulator [Acidimicrobiales bacterium]